MLLALGAASTALDAVQSLTSSSTIRPRRHRPALTRARPTRSRSPSPASTVPQPMPVTGFSAASQMSPATMSDAAGGAKPVIDRVEPDPRPPAHPRLAGLSSQIRRCRIGADIASASSYQFARPSCFSSETKAISFTGRAAVVQTSDAIPAARLDLRGLGKPDALSEAILFHAGNASGKGSAVAV